MRGLLIGRFQPFHLGHLEVVRHLRTAHPEDEVILGIGSAEASYTRENPFTSAERFEMIEGGLREAGLSGWIAVPIPDVHRHALWAAHVRELVPPFGRVYTNNPLTRLLFEREGFEAESTPLFHRERWEGTRVRKVIVEEGDWHALVPGSVARYLEEIRAPARLRLLHER